MFKLGMGSGEEAKWWRPLEKRSLEMVIAVSCVKGCLQVAEKEVTWMTLRWRREGREWLLI